MSGYNVLDRYPDLRQELSNKANQLSTYINSMDLDSANNHLNKIYAEAKVIPKIFSTFYESLDQQALYLRDYIVMCDVVLLFVRASRDGDWGLHLSALDKIVPYFFAYDQWNYAHHSPLYLATMTKLKTKEINSCNYLKVTSAIKLFFVIKQRLMCN